MRKIILLWAVLIWTARPLYPAQAAVSAVCAYPASLTLDGVDLSLCLPFALGSFQVAEPDNKIQMASAVDAASQRQLSISALPLGVRPSSEILPVIETGQEAAYRAILQEYRAQQGGVAAEAPSIRLFDREIPGAANVVSLYMDGIHLQAVRISEWLAEAGGRIWLVRLSEPLPARSGSLAPQSTLGAITLSATNPAAASTSLASLKAGLQAAPTLLAPQQTQANLPSPSWWNGDCDTNTYQAAAGVPAYPLGASFLGMKACGPRPMYGGMDVPVHFIPNSWGAYEWECVELSLRYLYLAYGITPYAANGSQVVENYSGSRLVKISNGTVGKAPRPGDVVSYGTTSTVGHTAVISAANVDAYGNGTVTIIEENAAASGARTHTVANWTVQDYMGMTAWLHDPTYDNNIPPIVTFSSSNPPTGQWYTNNRTIAWSSSDYVGMWGYSQAWDVDPGGSAPQVVGSASGSASLNGLAPGQHTLYVRVWDNSTNHNTKVYTSGWYGYDPVAPSGIWVSFIEGETIATRSLPLRVNVADTGGSGLSHARVMAAWSGQAALEVISNITGSGLYNWDLCVTGVPNGQSISVSLEVWDQAGNVTQAAGGTRHFVKNYACSTTVQVSMNQPSSLTPTYTGLNNGCDDYWKRFTDLNNNPSYLTFNAVSQEKSTNSGRWTPNLPAAGQYKVEALIPRHSYFQICNTAPPTQDTGNAQYQINYSGGTATKTVNQQAFADQWADLGTYTFAAGAGGSVTLTDLTGETNLSRYVVFSEMRFTPLAAPAACYGLNVGIFPTSGASLSVTQPNCGASQYNPGTQIQVSLNAQPGYSLRLWDGSVQSTSNPLTLTMNADQALVAYLNMPYSTFVPLASR